MIYFSLFIMCILVIETSYWLGLMAHIRAIIIASRASIDCILSKHISDAEKEKTARTNSLAILKDTCLFVVKFGIAAAIVFATYGVLLQFTDISLDHLASLLISWSVLITLSIFSVVYIKIRYGHIK